MTAMLLIQNRFTDHGMIVIKHNWLLTKKADADRDHLCGPPTRGQRHGGNVTGPPTRGQRHGPASRGQRHGPTLYWVCTEEKIELHVNQSAVNEEKIQSTNNIPRQGGSNMTVLL